MRFLKNIQHFFSPKKESVISINNKENNYDSPEEIISNSYSFYNKEDLIFFPNLNVYGAFKYNVVRDILANNKAITVSDVHIALNSIYFSLDEQKHQNNKKAAYKHLNFLSKNFSNESNQSTEKLLEFLRSHFPIDTPFDLSEYLIKPFTFINIIEEYGFLEFMPQFNPWSTEYNHKYALKLINDYYDDSNLLTNLVTDYLNEGKPIPDRMYHFLSDIQSDYEINKDLLVQFFASMIFSGTHSTASFLTSFFHVLYTQYKHLLESPLNLKELEILENEVLRIYMPVQWIFRTVREDTHYAGINFKKGDTVLLFVGVANTDPNVFDEPSEIKFDRKINHLSFGIGPYACIGKFATHRNAVNLVSHLSNYTRQIKLVDKNAKHTIHNAILKIPLIVVYNDL
jgi:hypothetical protein